MPSIRDQQDKEKLSLLSDDEFVAIIEAQYVKNGQPVDDIAKDQVWRDLDAKIHHDTKKAFRSWLPLATAAVLILTLVPLLLLEKDGSGSRIKGVASPATLNLSAYVVNSSGELTASTGTHKFGSTVVFKVDSAQKLAIALALAKNKENAVVRFVSSTLQPGHGQILQQNGKTYGYMFEPTDKNLRFCVFAADNSAALKARIKTLENIWQTLPAQSCVQIYVHN